MKIPNFIARKVLEKTEIIVDIADAAHDGRVRVYAYYDGKLTHESEGAAGRPYKKFKNPFAPSPNAQNAAMTGRERYVRSRKV